MIRQIPTPVPPKFNQPSFGETPSSFSGDIRIMTVRLMDNGFVVSYPVIVNSQQGASIKIKEVVCKTIDEVIQELAEFQMNRDMLGNVG